jgi:hypothetical protein
MSESLRQLPSEAVEQPAEITLDVLSDGAFSDARTTYQGIKRVLIGRIEQARLAGQIYWERGEVVDRQVDIDGMAGKVRYIPTFAYRRTLYDQRPDCQCSLCGVIETGHEAISLPSKIADTSFVDKFNSTFAVSLNNFPYLDSQMLLASRQHRELFTDDQNRLLFDFMAHSGFAGAAMQLESSGATIPKHAHVSIFDEALPIFSSNYRSLKEDDGVVVAASAEHPSVCYKVYGDSMDARFDQTKAIIRVLATRGLSFNLYLDDKANAYVIPRTNLRSAAMNMKVGLSLPAGMHNGYVEHSTSTDIEQLKREIWQNCQETTGDQLAAALRDTTVQGEDPAAIL